MLQQRGHKQEPLSHQAINPGLGMHSLPGMAQTAWLRREAPPERGTFHKLTYMKRISVV